MNTKVNISFLMVVSSFVCSLDATEIPSLIKGMSYQEAKTLHEQFMEGNPTKAQRLNAMREMVIASPVGERGLRQIYRNFDGLYAIDPSIANVEKSLLMEYSGSKSQAKGYRRELLYAVAFHNDPRYTLTTMNEPLKRSWGNTDADIVMRHRLTGLAGRIEVKNYSDKSQYTNIKYLKNQIDKMSREGAQSGHLQFWVNRRNVVPEITRYSISKGVIPMGNVSTGRVGQVGTMTSNEALAEMQKHFFKADRNRVTMGAAQLVFGAWLLIDGLPVALRDLDSAMHSSTDASQAWLRVGQSGSSAVAGGAMTYSGMSFAGARYAGSGSQSTLYSMGKAGGIVAITALGMSESFLIARFASGDVSSQDFWTSQWVLMTSGVGGVTGSWAGGSVSFLLLKNPFWGALAGSGLGGWLGQAIGNSTARWYYDWKFGELDKKYGEWVYTEYQVK